MIKGLLIGLFASASAVDPPVPAVSPEIKNPSAIVPISPGMENPGTDPKLSLRGSTTPTPLTKENYALAETQNIFTKLIPKIAEGTKTDGVGKFLHYRQPFDPADKMVVRTNYDTLYSVAILDLTEPATLTMPETQGRYQTGWLVTEDEYNPLSNPNILAESGTFEITKEKVGSPFAMLIVRTMAKMTDPKDLALAHKLQDAVQLTQKSAGKYLASGKFDMQEILKMRKMYQKLVAEQKIPTDKMFGKKGEVSIDNHNAGVAYGWGWLTPDMAAYIPYAPTSTKPQTLTLKDVPISKDAFWSITVYDKDGFVKDGSKSFHLSSEDAVKESDGSYIIHFGSKLEHMKTKGKDFLSKVGGKVETLKGELYNKFNLKDDQKGNSITSEGGSGGGNFLEVFDGWNVLLRMYKPTEAYATGKWSKPELVMKKD